MEDLTITQVETSHPNLPHLVAAQSRNISGLYSRNAQERAGAHLVDDGTVRAQLRRQFSRLSSPTTSTNSSFVPASAGRSRQRHHHRHHRAAADHFCARLLACTPSLSTHEDEPAKPTVSACYSSLDHAVQQLGRVMSTIHAAQQPDSALPLSAARPRGVSDAAGPGFVWLDVHGVPPATAATRTDAAGTRHAQEDVTGDPLAPLWAYLELASVHREQLRAAVQPRADRHRAAAHADTTRIRRSHSALRMHSTDADTFSQASTSSASSASSASSSSDTDTDDSPSHADVVGLADLYDERLENMAEPDTVDVRSHSRPLTGAYPDYYAFMQIAAQLDEIECTGAGSGSNGTDGVTLLTAEEGWNLETATSQELRDSAAQTSSRGGTATSASVFERYKAAGTRDVLSASWVRTLNASLMAMPTQQSLRQSFIGAAATEPPAASRRTSRLELRRAAGTGAGVGTQRGSSLTPIVGLYVLCFPNLCVTWCPSSTLSVAPPSSSASAANSRSTHIVQGWESLQQAIFARCAGTVPQQPAAEPLCTATFLSTLLTVVCSAYLPDTAAILSEVDAIDAMMPLICPEHESDQVDALRRVVLLRRKLSVHRRLLYQKAHLLECLQRVRVGALAPFVLRPPSSWPRDEPEVGTWAVSALSPQLAPTMTERSVHRRLYENMQTVLQRLDAARVVLSHTTIIYTSSVTVRNATDSTGTDYYQLKIGFILLCVLPMNLLASHWGMNSLVPWQTGIVTDSLVPFCAIVGIAAAFIILSLAYPMWVFVKGRPELIATL